MKNFFKALVCVLALTMVCGFALAGNADDYLGTYGDGIVIVYGTGDTGEAVGFVNTNGYELTDVYGVSYTVELVQEEIAADEFWIGGGLGVNSESTGWTILAEWGKANGERPIVIEDNLNGTTCVLTYLSDNPIFAAYDTYAQFWLQVWGGTATVTGVDILGADGQPLDTSMNPVDHIELVSGTSNQFVENFDGWYETEYNPETGEYDLEYFYYYLWNLSDAVIKIVYKDGTSTTANVGDYIDGYEVWNYSNQHDDHWEVGSDNVAIITYLGHEVEIPITVVENPVDHIELVSGTSFQFVENFNGWYDTEYNPETGEYDLEYFHYYLWNLYDAVIKIVYKDGTSTTANVGDYIDGYYVWHYDNQYDDHWEVGLDNVAIITYLGHEVEIPITVVENPIYHIELVSGISYQFVENYDGGYKTEYNPETGEYDLEYFYYPFVDHLYDAVIKIVYKDGTSTTANVGDYIDGYEVWCYDNQYDDHWEVGSDNVAIITYLDHEVEISITIVEESVEILVKGDVNGDGKVTSVDARWILQAAAGNRDLGDYDSAADVNGDGKVTSVDARWVLQAAAGNRVL